ncbi:hypothetical protein ABT086_38915, partial [Streptomyces mirabilis]
RRLPARLGRTPPAASAQHLRGTLQRLPHLFRAPQPVLKILPLGGGLILIGLGLGLAFLALRLRRG